MVVADNLMFDDTADRAVSYDFIEYRCDGADRRVEIRRRRLDSGGDGYGIERHILTNTIRSLNRALRQKPGCDCADHYYG